MTNRILSILDFNRKLIFDTQLIRKLSDLPEKGEVMKFLYYSKF